MSFEFKRGPQPDRRRAERRVTIDRRMVGDRRGPERRKAFALVFRENRSGRVRRTGIDRRTTLDRRELRDRRAVSGART